jgi:hypothetical protein
MIDRADLLSRVLECPLSLHRDPEPSAAEVEDVHLSLYIARGVEYSQLF